jgi:hypothetical protein
MNTQKTVAVDMDDLFWRLANDILCLLQTSDDASAFMVAQQISGGIAALFMNRIINVGQMSRAMELLEAAEAYRATR